MASQHLFYRYYDTLFTTKDYGGEIAALLRICRGLRLQPLRRVLEVGCGTGNHTLALAGQAGLQVTAVDRDPVMLALAQEKAALTGMTNIGFGEMDGEPNDLAVALFNVINYLLSEEDLRSLFIRIHRHLRPGGLFVFDCWNGTAALLDPPGEKQYERPCAEGRILCHLISRTDLARRITTMDYQLQLLDPAGEVVESGLYQIEHRLWTPEEIASLLAEAGFSVHRVCLPFDFERSAEASDWKIMFVSER